MLPARTLTGPRHGTRLPPCVSSEPTYVMVAGDTEAEARFIRRTLRGAGYQVLATKVGVELPRDLRRRVDRALRSNPVELLVLESVHQPWVATALLEVIREAYAALPIILIVGRDAELRKEARRLAVDKVLDAPVAADVLLRAAQHLAPPIAELGVKPRG